MIWCSDDSLYTGIAIDVDKRFRQHAAQKGAKYFRTCRPERIVFLEIGHNKASASRREAEIKKMKRAEKVQLIGEKTADLAG